MYAKILVALDNSAASQQVFRAALGIARAYQSEMMLLHVLAPSSLRRLKWPGSNFRPAMN
jgi:nucleotide-binding universal stress UspA family protein